MKKTTRKLLLVTAFGLFLSSSIMASEEVDAFTLSFENNSNVEPVSAFISKVSYTTGVFDTNSVISMCYYTQK
jgi:hypothetical protein